jgi:hypothetical protein
MLDSRGQIAASILLVTEKTGAVLVSTVVA